MVLVQLTLMLPSVTQILAIVDHVYSILNTSENHDITIDVSIFFGLLGFSCAVIREALPRLLSAPLTVQAAKNWKNDA